MWWVLIPAFGVGFMAGILIMAALIWAGKRDEE